MKKILTAVLMLTIGTSMVEAQECDLNKDGFVNSSDVVYLYNYIANGPQDEVKNETITVNGVSFNMIGVEGGTFTMGVHAQDIIKNSHDVTLKNFSIGETEVTQALWKAVMGEIPTTSWGEAWTEYEGLGDNYPAYNVSYNDAVEFIEKLNALTGRKFRLPTEAEWEYAAIGGKYDHGCYFSGSNNIYEVGWFRLNSEKDGSLHMRPVKQLAHNELFIYDMTGNVMEWCADWYDEYDRATQVNPTGPDHGVYKVVRGGCFGQEISYCYLSTRDYLVPTEGKDSSHGFRLAL